MRKESECVHAGHYHDPATRGVNSPIFTSSSYEYLDRDQFPYPRYFNTPNQAAVVRKMCVLEGAEDGVLFSSGMAAITTTLLALVGAGDHVVMQEEVYGGTHAFVTHDFERLGIRYSFAATDAEAIAQAVQSETKAILIESPTNPLLSVVDIRRVAEFARQRGITTIIDNTFATPVNQNPLGLGIDVVVHSGTKYLGGHSDLCCGIALTSGVMAQRIRAMARHLGGSLNALSCYLLERSLKTLALRVARQTENAGRIARHLASHRLVPKVCYPGLENFPGYAIAKAQMIAFGGMLSFEVDNSIQPTAFLRRLRMVRPAVSLGGIETIICSPAATSHAKLTADDRRRIGISDSLLRLSVGIEHVEDVLADLEQALAGSA
jgi:cystathionine beta-lyase